jgi:uncharacterized membrane protein YkvI
MVLVSGFLGETFLFGVSGFIVFFIVIFLVIIFFLLFFWNKVSWWRNVEADRNRWVSVRSLDFFGWSAFLWKSWDWN